MIVCKKCGKSLTDLTQKCTACQSVVELSEKECNELFAKMNEAIKEGIYEEYYALAERLAASGFVPALREWGDLLESGELGEVRLDDAMRVFRRGALASDGYCAYRYSRLIDRESDTDSSFWLMFSAVLGTKEAAPAAARLLDELGCREDASYYYSLSAKCDNVDSIVAMAKRYSDGIGVPKSDAYAKWYMDKLTLPPIHALKLAYKLRAVAASEPPEPKNNLKELTVRLICAAKNNRFATAERRLTEMLAELGDISARVSLAEIYADGVGGDVNLPAARSSLEFAAMHGSSEAYKILGNYHLCGKLGEKNASLALDCYKRAAELGECDAYHLMADMYFSGELIERNIAYAAALYKRASISGDAEAGRKYEAIDARRNELYSRAAKYASEGMGEEAFSLFTLAHSMGQENAPIALAGAYLSGMGTKINRPRAFRLLSEAVSAKTREAYFPLALCYSRGIGVRMNYKAALRLLASANALGDSRAAGEAKRVRSRVMKKFARQSYSRAMRLLFSKKEASAIRELEYSSEMGLAKATYTLGAFYEFGFGTPCNREKAYALYALAEERGFCDPRNEYKLDVLKTSRKNKSDF